MDGQRAWRHHQQVPPNFAPGSPSLRRSFSSSRKMLPHNESTLMGQEVDIWSHWDNLDADRELGVAKSSQRGRDPVDG